MSRIRAAGGWTEEETEQLFEEARKAGEQGRPVKSVFAQIAALTGRKPNSIRNYYYLKLKENSSLAKAAFVPFEEEEVEPLTEIVAKINQTNATIETQTASLLDMLSQLHGTTPEADAELKKFVEEFKG